MVIAGESDTTIPFVIVPLLGDAVVGYEGGERRGLSVLLWKLKVGRWVTTVSMSVKPEGKVG